jgi:uncharacterized repeat protein (TIGR02543 family)
VAAGTATITARTSNGRTANATITVTAVHSGNANDLIGVWTGELENDFGLGGTSIDVFLENNVLAGVRTNYNLPGRTNQSAFSVRYSVAYDGATATYTLTPVSMITGSGGISNVATLKGKINGNVFSGQTLIGTRVLGNFSLTKQGSLQTLTRTITATAVPSNGGSVTGGGTVQLGSDITLRATPNQGWTFDGWFEAGVKMHENATWTFVVDSNRTLEARFSHNNSSNNNNNFNCEPISVGVKLWWPPALGGVGYRVYRSTDPTDDGVSITDFYITMHEFVDVNVKANTTYYYYVRQVISEAKPFEGQREVLGPPSERFMVRTGSNIIEPKNPGGDPNAVKKFIMMKIGDPMMSVNGIQQEIDPGRNTTPILLNQRTMVPIRAIVEAKGGTVGWNDATQEVSLTYRGQNVRMWLDNQTISVNGVNKEIDVAPTTRNQRTIVPIRFVAENLGSEIDWLNSTQQIVIVYY